MRSVHCDEGQHKFLRPVNNVEPVLTSRRVEFLLGPPRDNVPIRTILVKVSADVLLRLRRRVELVLTPLLTFESAISNYVK